MGKLVPEAILSLREKPVAGEIRSEVLEGARGTLARYRMITLFIHGFNVDELHGRTAYRAMMRNLPDVRRHGIFWVYWPGDVSPNYVLSALGYAYNPDRAVTCAKRLALHIAQETRAAPRGVELRIVAHSLGCRLALHLAANLLANLTIDVKLLVLMAAAVPRYMVLREGALDFIEYRRTLSSGRSVHPRFRVFWSSKDGALGTIFRLGQSFESSSPKNWFRNREALGRVGLRRDFLDTQPRRFLDHETRHGHGDYWGSRQVANTLAADLPSNVRSTGHRVTSGRKTKASRTVGGRAVASPVFRSARSGAGRRVV